jgi:hypothetical protein
MVHCSRKLNLFLITALLFTGWLSDPAMAAPVNLPSGEVIDLTANQVEWLKQDFGIYYFENRPQKLTAGNIQHWIMIELPAELGGGFLIGTPQNIAHGLTTVGAVNIPDAMPSVEGDPEVAASPSGQWKTKISQVPKWIWSFNTGYRNDDLSWSIAGLSPTIFLIPPLQGNSVNILSELTWNNLEIFQMEFSLERLIRQNYRLRGTLAYGVIFDGQNQDSDYAGNNRTFEFSRSNNGANDGSTSDFSIGLGYNFSFLWDVLTLSPLIGFSYHSQKLKMTQGIQTVSDFGWPTPLGPFPGLNSSYDTQWYGPWIGLEWTIGNQDKINITKGFGILLGIEYHWADYHAEANWNLRQAFAHPKSFEHDADGSGTVYIVDLNYFLNFQWSINLSGKYQKWETDPGVDRVFFFDGTVAETRLNNVNWESSSLSVGVTCRF